MPNAAVQKNGEHKSLDLAVLHTVAVFCLAPVERALPGVVFFSCPYNQFNKVYYRDQNRESKRHCLHTKEWEDHLKHRLQLLFAL
jgi:hypothetical protein